MSFDTTDRREAKTLLDNLAGSHVFPLELPLAYGKRTGLAILYDRAECVIASLGADPEIPGLEIAAPLPSNVQTRRTTLGDALGQPGRTGWADAARAA